MLWWLNYRAIVNVDKACLLLKAVALVKLASSEHIMMVLQDLPVYAVFCASHKHHASEP